MVLEIEMQILSYNQTQCISSSGGGPSSLCCTRPPGASDTGFCLRTPLEGTPFPSYCPNYRKSAAMYKAHSKGILARMLKIPGWNILGELQWTTESLLDFMIEMGP